MVILIKRNEPETLMQTFLEGKDLHFITLLTLCMEDFLLRM